MTLLNCRECQGPVSSQANACPRCGCPVLARKNETKDVIGNVQDKVNGDQGEIGSQRDSHSDTQGNSEHVTQPALLPKSTGGKSSLSTQSTSATDKPARDAKKRRDPPAGAERTRARQLDAELHTIKIKIAVVVVLVFLAVSATVWFLANRSEMAGIAQEKEKLAQEESRRTTVETVNMINSAMKSGASEKRLKYVTERLELLRHPMSLPLGVARRQFGIDEETGLAMFECNTLQGLVVLLANPDNVRVGANFDGTKVAKVDRRSFTLTKSHELTGAQTKSVEYADVYEMVTDARIAALEKEAGELRAINSTK